MLPTAADHGPARWWVARSALRGRAAASYAAFGLGDTDLGIGQQDADGVALAAIQGLNQLVAGQRDQIAAQQAEIAMLRAQSLAEIADLKRAVEVLLARTAPDDRLAAVH